MTGTMESKQKIMIVDDTPQNLKLLGNMLREEGYQVYSFPKGEFALKAAERKIPDLILLDINMPGMNGYEVCAKLKENPVLREIPVIFLSALNEAEDKVKAFHSGGVDYITKPFQLEEVTARIRTHLALRDAQRDLKDLLHSTVTGSVRAMAELLALISPEDFGQALRAARYVRGMAHRMDLPKPWKYEIAALLSNLGYAVSREDSSKNLREERIQKLLGGDQSRESDRNVELAAKVIRCIPRFENVPEMLMEQRYFPEWNTSWHRWSEEVLGGQILKMANDFGALAVHFGSAFRALSEMKKIQGVYNQELLEFLEDALANEVQGKSEKISPQDLERGMILVRDLLNRQGVPLLSQGTELTEHMLERIREWASLGVVSRMTPIPVLLPPKKALSEEEAAQEGLKDFFASDLSE